MAEKRRALGRGLRALIPEPVAPLRREPAQEVDLDLLRPNREQPRGTIEDARLAELAESIRAHGIIQPLVVTRQEDGKFEIVAGGAPLAGRAAGGAAAGAGGRAHGREQQAPRAGPDREHPA